MIRNSLIVFGLSLAASTALAQQPLNCPIGYRCIPDDYSSRLARAQAEQARIVKAQWDAVRATMDEEMIAHSYGARPMPPIIEPPPLRDPLDGALLH